MISAVSRVFFGSSADWLAVWADRVVASLAAMCTVLTCRLNALKSSESRTNPQPSTTQCKCFRLMEHERSNPHGSAAVSGSTWYHLWSEPRRVGCPGVSPRPAQPSRPFRGTLLPAVRVAADLIRGSSIPLDLAWTRRRRGGDDWDSKASPWGGPLSVTVSGLMVEVDCKGDCVGVGASAGSNAGADSVMVLRCRTVLGELRVATLCVPRRARGVSASSSCGRSAETSTSRPTPDCNSASGRVTVSVNTGGSVRPVVLVSPSRPPSVDGASASSGGGDGSSSALVTGRTTVMVARCFTAFKSVGLEEAEVPSAAVAPLTRLPVPCCFFALSLPRSFRRK
mmetsp:Transcript_14652/g.43382  ORF Transcript_14652/g.43382 Transcript_14652/m.43382 type:complete len:339 (-) Transcript_14652:280-1296(-)